MTNPMTSAQPTLQVDNDRVRVTEWRFAPGAATGWHRHGYDYVVVPLTTGRLLLRDGKGGETAAELVAGRSYYRPLGVEHDVVNGNDYEFAFVEIEIKTPASPSPVPADPDS
jgi:quercetin dioxygenase-like cupin family protein